MSIEVRWGESKLDNAVELFRSSSLCDSSDMRASRRPAVTAVLMSASASLCLLTAPHAEAVPAPEVEYTYDVVVRRHFDFPNNDALGYGFGICDKVKQGVPYAGVMADVKRDVFPNDEDAANYVVSYAVGILCPAQIWLLRNSAQGYRPPN